MPYNLHPARVFLGDSGATAVGFSLACLTLSAGSKLSVGLAVLVPLLAIGVPVADTLLSILRRVLGGVQRKTGVTIFRADREHIHHRLVGLGLNPGRAVLILYGVGMATAAVGIVSLFVSASNAGLLLATLVVASFIGVGRLRYDEFGVLRSGVVLKLYDTAVIKSGTFKVFVDIGLVMLAFYGAVVLKYDDWDLATHRPLLVTGLALLPAINLAVFWVNRVYARAWQFASLDDVISVNGAVCVSAGLGLVLTRMLVDSGASVTLFATYAVLLMLGTSAGRSSFRVLAYFKEATPQDGPRVAVYGAGTRGKLALREMQRNGALHLQAVGFIDDDPSLLGRRLGGLPVLGDVTQLGRIIREHRLDGVLFASRLRRGGHRSLSVQPRRPRAVAAGGVRSGSRGVRSGRRRIGLATHTPSPPTRMNRLTLACAALVALCSAGVVHAQSADVTIAPEDVVLVTVDGQPELSGQYAVDSNGSVLLPLIGRVEAEGLTARALTGVLAGRLDTYINAPRVLVEVRRPQRVFVFGEVQNPGLYDLTDGLTILELLLRARYSGVSEVLVVRTGNVRVPVLPDQARPSDVIRVNLRQLESDVEHGDLSRNLRLEAGDTVFVPTFDPNTVFVGGQVNSPGEYSVADGTTVLQMLTLAGWVTRQGSPARVRIVRFVDGERTEHRAALDAVVQPGDMVDVPEAFFNPSFTVAAGAPTLSVGEIRVGRSLTITPLLPLTQVGIDSRVVDANGDRQSDLVVELTPQVWMGLDLRRVRVEGNLSAGLQYYRSFKSERAVNPGYDAAVEFDLARRVTFMAGYGFVSTRNRFSYDLDARVRRDERRTSAGVELGPWGRVGFALSGFLSERRIPEDATFDGQALRPTLEQDVQSATAAVNFELTPASSLAFSFTPATYRFPQFAASDADSSELRVETTFAQGALIAGRAHVGYLRYLVFDAAAQDYVGPVMGGELWHTWRERTEVGVRGERAIRSSFQSTSAYSVNDRFGGWIRQALSRRFDVVLDVNQNRYRYQAFDVPELDQPAPAALTALSYTAELGVLLGGSRVGLSTTYEERHGRRAYDAWRWGISYSIYGVRRQ